MLTFLAIKHVVWFTIQYLLHIFKGPDMWKPTGLESMQARRDAAVKRVQRMEEEADDEERRSKRANKRWEGRDGQMRTQFEIKLDPVSGKRPH